MKPRVVNCGVIVNTKTAKIFDPEHKTHISFPGRQAQALHRVVSTTTQPLLLVADRQSRFWVGILSLRSIFSHPPAFSSSYSSTQRTISPHAHAINSNKCDKCSRRQLAVHPAIRDEISALEHDHPSSAGDIIGLWWLGTSKTILRLPFSETS